MKKYRSYVLCGAVSALCLLIGLTDGYDTPDDEKKKDLHSKVQTLVMEFQDPKGSIICRELLGLEQGMTSQHPPSSQRNIMIIATKTAQLKALKDELAKVEKAAAASKNEEVANFIAGKGLNPAEVLAVLQEKFGQN